MHIENARLLRIFLGDSDKIAHIPVFEKIVLEARAFGLAGATVFKGFMGFGGTSKLIHTAKILRLSEDLPVVVEIVDDLIKIEQFLPILDNIIEQSQCGGLITIEKTRVIKYTSNKPKT